MKKLLNSSVLTFLLAVAPSLCFAEMTIEHVSKERAKELGMEIRSKAAGPDAVRVVLEFKAEGALKDFNRVALEMTDGGKLLLSSSLKEERSKPGHIVVSFTVDRANLEKTTLRVVVSEQALGGSGYELRVKDFVELKNAAAPAAPAPATPAPAAPAAATPEEEARFLAAVRKAFEARDASGLDALTCWDRVPEEMKKHIQASYKALVAEKGVVFDFKLVDPDLKFVDRDRTEDGVTYRANLPVTRQLNMKGIDARDKKTLMVLCFAVGEKDGKLLLLGSAPVK